jgi:hypothetical protein
MLETSEAMTGNPGIEMGSVRKWLGFAFTTILSTRQDAGKPQRLRFLIEAVTQRLRQKADLSQAS